MSYQTMRQKFMEEINKNKTQREEYEIYARLNTEYLNLSKRNGHSKEEIQRMKYLKGECNKQTCGSA